jgi:hypothetical protein
MIKYISSFFKKHNLTPIIILKLTGVVLLAVVVLSVFFDVFGFPPRTLGVRTGTSVFSVAPQMPLFTMGTRGEDSNIAFEKSYDSSYAPGGFTTSGAVGMPALSIRNILPVPPVFGGVTGNTAEQFEVTEYNASIETGNIEKTCKDITDLKALSYVIFENSSDYHGGCSHTFKVEHTRASEILSRIEALHPENISENTYTIKRQIDDFTSQTEILENKQKSIDETLESALKAYDDITRLATRTEDTETLARIINNKIQIIERLTMEQVNIGSQLEQLARAKADQLDRLEYTFFTVSAHEDKYLDWDSIKDAWKNALHNLIFTINRALQDATVNFLAFLVSLLPYILYILVCIGIGKYAWKIVKGVWKR